VLILKGLIAMKKDVTKLYEVDLYKPVKDYFTSEGYDVYGEVNDCDVVAVKEDELIIVELKLRLNLEKKFDCMSIIWGRTKLAHSTLLDLLWKTFM